MLGFEAGNNNYLQLIFLTMTGFVALFGILTNSCEFILPDFVRQSFRFGKMAFQGKHTGFVSNMEVPKSYFQHFYLYSSILMLGTLGYIISVYIFHLQIPERVFWFLDAIGGYPRHTAATPIHSILALFLLTIQCIKRFYDSNFVSVFGKNSKMHLSHYLVGYIHYTGCALAILLESPLFTFRHEDVAGVGNPPAVHFNDLKKSDVLAAVIFLIVCYLQLRVAVILGNLRKNPKGKIITDKHLIPQGGLFEYLSSPHMVCEILMYTCLSVILWENTTWIYIYLWVFTNQVEVILLNHWWYQEKFREFPAKRKALIPFIY